MKNDHEGVIVAIPAQIWRDFKRVSKENDEILTRQAAAILMVGALAEFIERQEDHHPYRVLPVEGGWNVFYCEEDKEPRLADSCLTPYPPDRKPNADRKRKTMNRKWWKAMKETEENMRQNGGAIIV
jgi:hypothetical protein